MAKITREQLIASMFPTQQTPVSMAESFAADFDRRTQGMDSVQKQRLLDTVLPRVADSFGQDLAANIEGLEVVKKPERTAGEMLSDWWNIGGAAVDNLQGAFYGVVNPHSERAIANQAERDENIAQLSEAQRYEDYLADKRMAEAGDSELAKVGAWIQNFAASPMRQGADLGVQAAATLAPIGLGIVAAPFTGGASIAAGGAAAAAMGAALGVGGARNELYEATMRQSDADLMRNNAQYAALRNQGMSEYDAKGVVGTNVKDHIPELAGAAVSGAVLERLGLGRLGGVGAGFARSMGKEMASEAADEAVQQGLANSMVQAVDPNRKLYEDVLLSGVQGAVGGVASGGLVGYMNRRPSEDVSSVSADSPPKAGSVDDIVYQAEQNRQRGYRPDENIGEPVSQPRENVAAAASEFQPQNAARVQQAAATTDTGRVEQGFDHDVIVRDRTEPLTWEIREASDMGATIAKAENQYRDRNRQASEQQINSIAGNLNYRRLNDAPEMDSGAPTLANDGKTVIGGNGRIAAVKQAYSQGTAEQYKADLIKDAPRFGFTPEQVAQFEQPVLVRRLKNDVDIQQAAIASNEGGSMAMSALEQAKADFTRLPPLELFQFNEDGSLNQGASRNAIAQFIGNLPENQRNGLMTSDGQVSQQGLQRIENAMMYQAYGDSPTLARAIESTSQERKNVNRALTQSANTIAQARNDAAPLESMGYGSIYDMDIADDLMRAADLFEQIRRDGGSVDDFLAQVDLERGQQPEIVQMLLSFIDRNSRSAKQMRELIQNYYDAVRGLGNPNEPDMFGDRVIPTREQLLKGLIDEQTDTATATESGNSGENGAIAERATAESRSFAFDLQPETESRNGQGDGSGLAQNGPAVSSANESVPAEPIEVGADEPSIFRYEEKHKGENTAARRGYLDVDMPSDYVIRRPDTTAGAKKPFRTETIANLLKQKSFEGQAFDNAILARRIEQEGGKYRPVSVKDKIPAKETLGVPAYSGNKRSFIQQAGGRLKKWLANDSHETLYDAFGGGGGYGLWLANHAAKNVKHLIVNEIDPLRSRKLEYFMRNGDKFARLYNEDASPALREAIVEMRKLEGFGSVIEVQASVLLDENSTSGSNSAREVNRKVFQRLKELGRHLTDMDKIAVQAIIDRAYAARGAEEGKAAIDRIIDGVISDAQNYHAEYVKFINRSAGNRVTFTVHDGRDTSKIPDNALTVFDPPYLYTQGYDSTGDLDSSFLNKPAFFEDTRKLVDVSVEKGNTVIYHNSMPVLAGIKKGEKYGGYTATENTRGMWQDFDEFLPFYRQSNPVTTDDFVGVIYGNQRNSEGRVHAESGNAGNRFDGAGIGGVSRPEGYGASQSVSEREAAPSRVPDRVSGESRDNPAVSDGNADTAISTGDLFSQADTALSRDRYETMKANGETELTFKQWQQVRTPEFKAWFGDWENDPENASKVVNPKTGEPLVVYHGSNTSNSGEPDFSVFKKGHGRVPRSGFYFTDNAEVSAEFSGFSPDEEGVIYPAFVNIRNPLDVEARGERWSEVPWAGEYSHNGKASTDRIALYAEESGVYDGVVFRNVKEAWSEVDANDFVPFDSNQIKSATGNSGAFDPNNDDIRFSLNEAEDSAFARAVDSVVVGKVKHNKYVTLGKTPDVLKMVGLPDVSFKISEAVIEKAIAQQLAKNVVKHKHAHNLTADSLKQLPKQLNNPVAVMKSGVRSTNPDGYVILTELIEHENGKDKPVIAALNLKRVGDDVEVVNVASVHGRRPSQIENMFNDGLLYVDMAKGRLLSDAVGVQFPQSLADKSSLSARNIKTETDLAQYRSAGETEVRKSHFGEHEHSNTGKSRITKHAETINKALGRLADRVELVSDVRQTLPESADRILSNKYDGAFDSSTGKVYLFAENLTPERAAFVAWHELGHRGVADSAFRRYRDELRKFGGNSTVAKLADEIQAQRPDSDPANQSRDVALEEAAVELYAAKQTGNWAALESRYGVKIPESVRRRADSMLGKLWEKLRAFVGRVFGRVSDSDMAALLDDLHRDVLGSETNNEADSDSLRFSQSFDGAPLKDAEAVREFSETGKYEPDDSVLRDMWESLKRDQAAQGRLKDRAESWKDKLLENFEDMHIQFQRWTESLPEDIVGKVAAQRLLGEFRRGAGKRDAENMNIVHEFINPLNKELARLQKRYPKMSLMEIKKAVGYHMSANYAPIANQRLIDKAQARVDEAQVALNGADESQVERLQKALDKEKADLANLKAAVDGRRAGKVAGGYSNAMAAEIKSNIEKLIAPEDLAAVQKHIRGMLNHKLELDLKSGRITPEMYEEFKANDQYVPFTGDPADPLEDGSQDAFLGGSNGINQSKDREMKGRVSMAEDAVDATFRAVNKSVAFYGYADFKHKLNDVYESAMSHYRRMGMTEDEARNTVAEEIGITRSGRSPFSRNSDDVIFHRVNGQEVEFRLRPQVMRGIQNANKEDGLLDNTVGRATRFYSRAYTQFNVSFAFTNAVRDMWEKSEMIRVMDIRKDDGSRVDLDRVARRAIWSALNGSIGKTTVKAAAMNDFSSPDGKLLKELMDLGGISTWGTFLSKTEKDLLGKVAKEANVARKTVKTAVDVVERYNQAFDLLPSLALYKSLIQAGVGKQAAADAVLETTNFRKQGARMGFIKSFYSFSQPTVIGAANLARYLSTKKGRNRFMGYSAVMIPLYMALRALGEEDEGGNELDKQGDITRYIPIKVGDKELLKIPVGFGMAQMAWNFATNSVKMSMGDISMAEGLANMGAHWSKTFAPVAPSEISPAKHPMEYLASTVTPTVFKPFMQDILDMNAFGSKLNGYVQSGKLKAEQSKTTTAPEWEEAAIWIQRNLGIDKTPEEVKNYVDGYFGISVLRTALDWAIENPNRRELGRAEKIPFINALYGAGNEFANQNRFYQAFDEAEAVSKEYDSRKERGDLDGWLDDDKRFKMDWYKRAKAMDSRISRRKANATRLFNKGGMSEESYRDVTLETIDRRADAQLPLLHEWRKHEGLNTTRR